jgi:hypothetical protein
VPPVPTWTRGHRRTRRGPGVIAWWLVPLSLLPMVAFGVLRGVVGSILAVACYAPNFLVGARLVQRARLAA